MFLILMLHILKGMKKVTVTPKKTKRVAHNGYFARFILADNERKTNQACMAEVVNSP